MTSQRSCAIAIACAAFVTSVAHAAPPELRWDWNLRARHEQVDDEAFAREAALTTLRLRAGFDARLPRGFGVRLEGEGVLADDDRANTTANGRAAYPAIADPEGAEINQAFLRWEGTRMAATLGRQRINLDNQRWIGAVGWRQNEQTFDAAQIELKPAKDWQVRYAWLDRAHRVNGDRARDPLLRERALDTHLLNVAHTRGIQRWVGYAYLHEDRDVARASSATYGVRWNAGRVAEGRGWGLTVEAAQQRDYGGNPDDFAHGYWLVEPSITHAGIAWRAGWEHLGGNGRHALQTPLATLHAFNGWADKFTTTPPGGLEDVYAGAGGKLPRGLEWAVTWHDYRADDGGRYGREWDASLAFPVGRQVKGLAKIADYRSDGFARDTRKLWLQLEWSR